MKLPNFFSRQKTAELASGNIKKNATQPKLIQDIVAKPIAQTQQDISKWKTAEKLTTLEDNPKWYLIQQLFREVLKDSLLTSQYKNRQLKALSERIVLKKSNGDVDEDQTDILNNAIFTNEINRHILDSKYFIHSLVEFTFDENDVLQVHLIPRDNVNPRDGWVYPDYTEDKKIEYRDTAEYGTWVVEFGEIGDMGLLNNAVPHVLFKRFAQSCWSELCEIYGIPPRVLKTNTQDPATLSRGEKMMKDIGAAAWFIIDENESMEWANAASTNGDVYKNLINLCNNEISLLMTGAVIGQDTKNGSRSKDESGREMLRTLIDSDLRLVEQYWNSTVIPALINMGVLKGELIYGYEPAENTKQLWDMTKDILAYKKVDDQWIKDKFGIEVIGDKEQPTQNLNLNHPDTFFD